MLTQCSAHAEVPPHWGRWMHALPSHDDHQMSQAFEHPTNTECDQKEVITIQAFSLQNLLDFNKGREKYHLNNYYNIIVIVFTWSYNYLLNTVVENL